MSKIRGVFPLFLATSFGIINGIWVFQPLLAAQQEGKEEQTTKNLNLARQSEESEAKIIREVEAAASRSSATESALKPIGSSSSWWPRMSLWSKAENAGAKESTRPKIEPTKKGNGGKEENT